MKEKVKLIKLGIFFYSLFLVGCNKVEVDFNYLEDIPYIDSEALNDCLNSHKLGLRYQCFYKIENNKIVLIDGGVLSFEEFKEIYRQIFELNFKKNRLERRVHKFIDGKELPISIEMGVIDTNRIEESKSYNKKVNESIKFFHLITSLKFGLTEKNKNRKNFIILSDNFEKDLELVYKDFFKGFKISKKKNFHSTMRGMINEVIENKLNFSTMYVHNVSNRKNVSIRNSAVVIPFSSHRAYVFNAIVSIFGFDNTKKFKTSVLGLRSIFNENQPTKGFAPLDALLLALWYHEEIPGGMKEADFYKKIEKLIYSNQRI